MLKHTSYKPMLFEVITSIRGYLESDKSLSYIRERSLLRIDVLHFVVFVKMASGFFLFLSRTSCVLFSFGFFLLFFSPALEIFRDVIETELCMCFPNVST